MKVKDVVVGMEVKLRKNVSKCTYTDGVGMIHLDCDLKSYEGGDVVKVLATPDSDGDVRVHKDGENYIIVNAKHLRKIKGEAK